MSGERIAAAEQRVADAKRLIDAARLSVIAAQDEFDQALDQLAIEITHAHTTMEQGEA